MFMISSFKRIKTKVICWLSSQVLFIDFTLSIIFFRDINSKRPHCKKYTLILLPSNIYLIRNIRNRKLPSSCRYFGKHEQKSTCRGYK